MGSRSAHNLGKWPAPLNKANKYSRSYNITTRSAQPQKEKIFNNLTSTEKRSKPSRNNTRSTLSCSYINIANKMITCVLLKYKFIKQKRTQWDLWVPQILKNNFQLFWRKILFMAIIHQKLFLALKYRYALSSYAFSGFNNKDYVFYFLRRVKDGQKWRKKSQHGCIRWVHPS